jgi:DedD protein
MDQGLKERLVGAAVLVAIGVWLIPWVLDGPENPTENSTSSLQLPAAEEPVPMRTQSLRIGAPADEPEASPAAAETEPSVAAPVTAEQPAEPIAEPVVAAATATPVAAPPVQTTAPAPRPAATPAPAPRAAAPAAAPVAQGDWVVQLGSFSAEDNARKLAQRAEQFGYKASVSSIRASGRTLYRVRVGPYETRRQADAAASALGAHGLKGQVVAAD